jgi:hypothetical protein
MFLENSNKDSKKKAATTLTFYRMGQGRHKLVKSRQYRKE